MDKKLPVLGICALKSGTGKTTLLESLIDLLTSNGVRVSLIKQTHATFDIDRPGKDSFRLREAGARQVILSAPKRWVMMTEQDHGVEDARLFEMLPHLDTTMADIVLVEGFRNAAFPKIEVYRPEDATPPLAASDPDIMAIVSDSHTGLPLPHFASGTIPQLAVFVQDWLKNQQTTPTPAAIA